MFERRKARRPQKRIDSLIGAGTVVHGNVMFAGGLRIDGAVDGKVTTATTRRGNW
jgi:cytoskeletal protein CcmA (bactofilin family)